MLNCRDEYRPGIARVPVQRALGLLGFVFRNRTRADKQAYSHSQPAGHLGTASSS